jgi:hypothetical protein
VSRAAFQRSRDGPGIGLQNVNEQAECIINESRANCAGWNNLARDQVMLFKIISPDDDVLVGVTTEELAKFHTGPDLDRLEPCASPLPVAAPDK